MSSKDSLLAISPADGRYSEKTKPLVSYFSEFAFFKYRLLIEIEYLVFLSEKRLMKPLSLSQKRGLRILYEKFSIEDAVKIKRLEEKTKHDVKAIEYFLREKLKKGYLKTLVAWIHFGLTSTDINDNAYRLMVLDAVKNVLIPEIADLVSSLKKLTTDYKRLPMLARTHGQPALPTTFGKEMAVFSERIEKELSTLASVKLYGKLGGAVGNWNALFFSFPNKNWVKLSSSFLKKLGLEHSKITTQIAPPEDLIGLFQLLFRINSIILDLDQDMWRYISDGWIIQKGKSKDVGSSTMPQKVNPIEFENSEGNLEFANGLFETFCRTLPISRLQRDLSDSTILRNIGLSFAHSLIGYKSAIRGLSSIAPNKGRVLLDLSNDWGILTEALQIVLRKEGRADAYEKVAEEVRGKTLSARDWMKIVNLFDLPLSKKRKLLALTPEKYIGLATKL